MSLNLQILLSIIQGLFSIIAAVIGALILTRNFPPWAAWALLAMPVALLIAFLAGYLLARDGGPLSVGFARIWRALNTVLLILAVTVNITVGVKYLLAPVPAGIGSGVTEPTPVAGVQPISKATVSITVVPPAGEGGPVETYPISGSVTQADVSRCKVVVFALAGNMAWYVQPTPDGAFTPIGTDGKWQTRSHPGLQYAAVLVEPTFKLPPNPTGGLPSVGGNVLAVKIEAGTQ